MGVTTRPFSPTSKKVQIEHAGSAHNSEHYLNNASAEGENLGGGERGGNNINIAGNGPIRRYKKRLFF